MSTRAARRTPRGLSSPGTPPDTPASVRPLPPRSLPPPHPLPLPPHLASASSAKPKPKPKLLPLHDRLLRSLADGVWRLWVWPGSAFGLTAMEPWEMVFSLIVYAHIIYLLGLFVLRLSPLDLCRRGARLLGFDEAPKAQYQYQ